MSIHLQPLSPRSESQSNMSRRSSRRRSANGPRQLNPDEYAEAVKHYSSLPKGPNYIRLSNFLQNKRNSSVVVQVDLVPSTRPRTPLDRQISGYQDIATVYPLTVGDRDGENDAANSPHAFQLPTQLYEFQPGKESCIVFLRGFLSAAWINNVGGRYFVDPEFFCRHLDFRSAQDKSNNFSVPSLPSSSWHLMELPVTTLGSWESSPFGTLPSSWIEKARKDGKAALLEHHHRLSKLSDSEMVVGESMIRDHYVFDEIHFAIDQRISICMQQAEDDSQEDEKRKFRLIVWIDAGTGASSRFTYPWDIEPLKSLLHPIINYRPMIALKGHLFQPSDSADMDPSTLQDSLSQLSKDYGRSLRRDTKALDPFYALTEILQFSANSQRQFLNMIDAKLQIYTTQSPAQDHEILPHLKYTQQILYRRILDIKRVLMSMENTTRPAWTKDAGEIGKQKSGIAARAIQSDFNDLLDHAESLYDRTKEAITVLQSSISITESHMASLQADKAQKLTFLAAVFVPVSVATGVFGMNFKELKAEKVSVYWFFVVVVIVAILIFALFKLNWNWLWRRNKKAT
ncbi:hypothetical protein PT974_03687 [Cladobotryum mycophilum]|uniref:Uncharacterized protein n=1 Tax=Cladobotryum mycophilum TaxID=491253 RepID=A0ABR0SU90_9HYPO